MKICFPVDQLKGLESEISPNFRASPALLVVDSETCGQLGIDAENGSCGALPAQIDAIVCAGGIGRGMFNNLRLRGIRVFNSDALTVADALAELAAGSLPEVNEVECCGGHAHDEAGEQAEQGCGCTGHGEHEHGEHGHAQGGGCGCAQH
jgi:predicted Fe-Mo cluster-binding NifX family protein